MSSEDPTERYGPYNWTNSIKPDSLTSWGHWSILGSQVHDGQGKTNTTSDGCHWRWRWTSPDVNTNCFDWHWRATHSPTATEVISNFVVTKHVVLFKEFTMSTANPPLHLCIPVECSNNIPRSIKRPFMINYFLGKIWHCNPASRTVHGGGGGEKGYFRPSWLNTIRKNKRKTKDKQGFYRGRVPPREPEGWHMWWNTDCLATSHLLLRESMPGLSNMWQRHCPRMIP